MYPFGSLPSNLIAFGDFLRCEYGFQIGSGELHDAARALEVVDLADELAVRNALRPILSRTLDDVSVFDQAFTAFFFPGPEGVRQSALKPMRREFGPEADRDEARVAVERRLAPDASDEEEEARR